MTFERSDGASVEIVVPFFADRHVPPSALAEQARMIQETGVADALLIPDQLANFIPRQLWTVENAPLAGVMPDPDSHSDAFMMAGYIAAAVPELAIHISTDAVRRPPAEFVQAMLTLANITQGRATFEIGGGEIKQTKPFGHPTNQGMSRMSDLFQITRRFLESDEPFDFEGRRTTLQNAFLGGARPYRPEFVALGAGPQLIDHATSFADGLAVTTPQAWTSPEMAAEKIAHIRSELERKGRDPEQFRFGLWASVLLHEDAEMLEQRLENPVIKFLTGIAGRIETRQWHDEGLGLPLPDGYTYYKNLLPYDTDQSLIDDVLSHTTRTHAEKGWFLGSPAEVADQISPWIEVGFDWVMPIDFLGLVADVEEAPQVLARLLATCEQLRAAHSSRAAAR